MKVESKRMLMRLSSFVIIATVLPRQTLLAQNLAFPTAEGFGAYAEGGRGGDVYYVTNLNDSGAGSLRNGIDSATGPRTIVFAVSGTIQLQSQLNVDKDFITIAGQTAPGDGICLRDWPFFIKGNHIIVRFIRSRLGDTSGQERDAIDIEQGHDVILDHCSASWSVDETLSCNDGAVENLTVQWCLVSESLNDSIHTKGPHGYGGIIGATTASYHHNLFAHHNSRNPKVTWRNYCQTDFRNNVIYNWGGNSCYDGSVAHMNWVNNYYKYGPATTVRDRIFKLYNVDDAPDAATYECQMYATGNYVWGYPGITADNWSGGIDFDTGTSEALNRVYSPFSYPAINEQSPADAYADVLSHVGASMIRDSVDTRVISEVSSRTATYGNGIIDSQDDVGGWPTLNSLPAPTDTDQDGMPDEWEWAVCLNPNDANDRNDDRDNDGYTNVEEYLNWLPSGEPMPANTNINCDDIVNFIDFSEFADRWMSVYGDAVYSGRFDYGHNDAIGMDDLFYMAQDWLTGGQEY